MSADEQIEAVVSEYRRRLVALARQRHTGTVTAEAAMRNGGIGHGKIRFEQAVDLKK